MNEKQKKVTDQYRSNWDEIFKKKGSNGFAERNSESREKSFGKEVLSEVPKDEN